MTKNHVFQTIAAHRFLPLLVFNMLVTGVRDAVKTGDIVKVRVTEVDMMRKRIGLRMKLGTLLP